jgi:competence protein ComEC
MAEGTATPSIAAPPLQTGRRRPGSRVVEAIESWLEAERDQLPLWLPVALAAGVALWFVLPDESAWRAAFLAALGLSAIGMTFAGGRRIAWRWQSPGLPSRWA